MTTLDVFGGGQMTMGANIVNVQSVVLNSAPVNTFQPNYVFTANDQSNLKIVGSSGNDTITLENATQSVIGGKGSDHVYVSAANAGALIELGVGDNVIEVTTAGTATLNAKDNNATVVLDQSGVLTLSAGANMTAIGTSGADTLIAMARGQTLTGGGGADTLVGFKSGSDLFQDTTADLNGVTIKNFAAKGDKIDLTDLDAQTATVSWSQGATSGVLTVSDGINTAQVTLLGQFAAAGFSAPVSDGATGTDITYTPPPAHPLAVAHG